MSDLAFGATRQAVAAHNRSLPGRVTGKLYRAIDAMVWAGASRKEAAQVAGLSDHGLRQALRRPHVLAHYLSECEVLRVSGRAKRLHRLEELAEQNTNMNAAVAAIKTAELMPDDPVKRGGAVASPGVVIRVVNLVAPSDPGPRDVAQIIDAEQ
jgi:hypothetical protein